MADAMKIAFGSPIALASENSLAFTNTSLGTINYKLGHCFMMPRADTITHLGFRYGARTSTPPQHTISLQSLDGSGLPDGTILGGGSPASATFTPPADTTWDGKWQWIALSNSYTCTRGQLLAVVIDCTSSPAGGSSSFTRTTNSCLSFMENLPYPATNTGSWAKAGNVYQTVFGVKSSTDVYGKPLQAITTQSTGTTGNRLALKFTLPAAWGSTYKVLGFRMMTNAALASVTSTFKIGLWNAAGTALQSYAAVDSDQVKVANGVSELYFSDTSLTALNFGTAYYVGLESESSTTTRMSTLDLAAANDWLAYPLGTNACYSTWNGSSWSDTTTSRPWLELIIDDITAPSGGSGGLLTHGGMTGGMRG